MGHKQPGCEERDWVGWWRRLENLIFIRMTNSLHLLPEVMVSSRLWEEVQSAEMVNLSGDERVGMRNSLEFFQIFK